MGDVTTLNYFRPYAKKAKAALLREDLSELLINLTVMYYATRDKDERALVFDAAMYMLEGDPSSASDQLDDIIQL